MWHVAGGWLGNVLIILQGLLLIPLYIDLLGERLYGFWLASGGVLAWISMVDVGGSSITKLRCASAYAKKEIEAVVAYFWHGAVITTAVIVTFLFLVFFLGGHVVQWLSVDETYVEIIFNCFMLAGFATGLNLANNFLRDFASALQRNKIPVFLQTLGDLFGLIGILVSLLIFRLGLLSLVIGVLLRNFIPFLGNLFHSYLILNSSGCKYSWSGRVFNDYVSTMPSVLGAKASGNLTNQLPVVILGKFFGPELAVAYTVSMRLLQMGQHFINHGLSALNAACSHFYGDPHLDVEAKRKLVKSLSRGYTFLAGCAVLGYALFNHGFIVLWTGEEQFVGQDFTILAAIASFLLLRSSILSSQIAALGLIRQSGNASILEQILKGLFILVGTYAFGILGIPFAIICAGLFTQFLYFKILMHRDSVVKEGLNPLMWTWVPIAGFVGATGFFSRLFIVEDWYVFLCYTAIVGMGLGFVAIYSVPQFKETIRNFASSVLRLINLRFLNVKS